MKIDDLTPYLDSELAPLFAATPPLDLSSANIQTTRKASRAMVQQMRDQMPELPHVDIEDREIPGPEGAPPVPVRILRPAKPVASNGAVLVWIHGGGFLSGHHEDVDPQVAPWVQATGMTVVSVGYRLAPEHRFPAAPEDCYAALCWAADSKNIGFVPTKIAVGGISAGGCLAAAVTLMARDRGGPELCFQILQIPALDNRHETPSSQAITDPRIWSRQVSLDSWAMYVGPNPTQETSPYAAPAREQDLSGLPPCYIEVSELDLLRDEAVEYANRLTQAGVRTELHVYPGTMHGSTVMPNSTISRRAIADLTAAVTTALA